MSVWTIEAQAIERIRNAAPEGIALHGTFDPVDWASEYAPTAGGHLVFNGISPDQQVKTAAMTSVRFSFHVYLDTARAHDADRYAAEALFTAALQAVLGWEWKTGLAAALQEGAQTGFDGRLSRISFSFAVPVPRTGLE